MRRALRDEKRPGALRTVARARAKHAAQRRQHRFRRFGFRQYVDEHRRVDGGHVDERRELAAANVGPRRAAARGGDRGWIVIDADHAGEVLGEKLGARAFPTSAVEHRRRRTELVNG
jgi:hypothetical protein